MLTLRLLFIDLEMGYSFHTLGVSLSIFLHPRDWNFYILVSLGDRDWSLPPPTEKERKDLAALTKAVSKAIEDSR